MDVVIDLRFMLVKLRRWWWLILLFTALGAGKGVKNLHSFSPSFEAKMVVAPSESSNQAVTVGGGGLRSIGLAGMLPGVTLSSTGGATRFERMVHAASTISLARRIDKKFNLMKVIYAGSWDAETQSWKRPSGRKFEWRQKINRYLNFPLWSAPTLENLAGYLGGSFVVAPVLDTQFKLISFKHRDAERALHFLALVYREATALVTEQDRVQLKKERRYLDDRLSRTAVIEFRDGLVNVYADLERRAMMLEGDLPSVARIVEPPYVSKYMTQPSVLTRFGLPTVTGFALAVGLIVMIALFRHE
ncbi:MAG TPA: hypothetical protein QF509_06910 [Rhodospirillales bacterium]|jgi:hypothetical protein|nr:hypothetical protein [Rhodospirillales bacterium]